jgi:carotenoid 1,2-hydratase
MQLLTGPSHDVSHHLEASGAYEWWYVDALETPTDDALSPSWGVVVILFRGMPMSPAYLQEQRSPQGSFPGQHCGMAVSIYYGARRVAFAFREIPEEQFTIPAHEFVVDTTHPEVSQALRVRVTLPESPLQNSDSDSDSDSETDAHGWVLVAPRVQASVHVEIAEDGIVMTSASWNGLAYRDHNFGNRPLQADFHDWYWGRVHADDRTLVFLAAPDARTPFVAAGEVSADGRQWRPWTNVRFHAEQTRMSMMGLVSGRRSRLVGTDADGRERVLICSHRWVVENGPFYQRYISEWSLDGRGLGRGTSEYMNAARLGSAWTWPFLRLPFFRQPRS